MNSSTNTSEQSPEEINLVSKILSRFQPGQLPLDVFIEVARLTVTPIIEVVPLRRNAEGVIEVLLIRREDSDPIWAGLLHTPGTVVRANDKDINNGDAFGRILNGELGGIQTSEPRFVKTILHKVKRGMEQAQIFWVEVKDEPLKGKFYPATKLPEATVATQIDFIMAAVEDFES